MKKILVLFVLSVMTFGCTTGKRVIEKEDIPGEWKEIERRAAKNSPVWDMTDCEDKARKTGDVYTFNADGAYLIKNTCSGEVNSKDNSWSYADNILTLTNTSSELEIEYKYSVIDQGNNQIKLSLVLFREGADVIDYINDYYMILEKQ